ncbi:pseudouridine synthase [Fibrobacterales bacterium]|nr:pseudouridine synthase [Fibrobacterales bacterium]
MEEIKVGIHDSEQRLDRFLRKTFPNVSINFLFSILRKKKVRVNGAVGKAAQKLALGDNICIYENLPQQQIEKSFATEIIPKLEFALLRDDFAIIEKMCGVPSQSGTNLQKGESLVEQLEAWAFHNNKTDFKPALAHRLDKDTSGVIIAALTGQALRKLTEIIRDRKIKKEYLALVKGHIEKKKGTIDLPLDKEAITHYEVVKSFVDFDLVRARIETGRKHQIRLHFAKIGHPIYGDSLHGDFAWNRECKKKFGISRLFLHSAYLEFEWDGEVIKIESQLPQELQKLMQVISKN